MYPLGIADWSRPHFPSHRRQRARILFLACAGFLLICVNRHLLSAQPYGLDQPQPIAPYLNGVFPPVAPSASASWNVEIAFTNISIDQPIFMLPYPGTNRLVILRKPGVIS